MTHKLSYEKLPRSKVLTRKTGLFYEGGSTSIGTNLLFLKTVVNIHTLMCIANKCLQKCGIVICKHSFYNIVHLYIYPFISVMFIVHTQPKMVYFYQNQKKYISRWLEMLQNLPYFIYYIRKPM